MINKLQTLLKKFNEEDFNWDEVEEIIAYLKGKLNNSNEITDEELKTIVNFQDENGRFSLVDKNYECKIPWEGKLDLIYFPSYYLTLILVKYSNYNNSEIYKNEIVKALDFCCSRKFVGHGYESIKTQIEVANLFIENGIKEYIKKNNLENSNISKLINELYDTYTQMILEGKFYGPWGENYLEEMERFINNMDDCIYYIAYGSNLNKKQMKERCPDSVCVGSSILENYKLKFNLYLTVESKENSCVPVGIYKISKNDERKLDRYEGYPRLYRKEYIEIKVNGIRRKCLIYIMNYIEDRIDQKPTLEYLKRCKKGYEDFGFNPNDLDKYL